MAEEAAKEASTVAPTAVPVAEEVSNSADDVKMDDAKPVEAAVQDTKMEEATPSVPTPVEAKADDVKEVKADVPDPQIAVPESGETAAADAPDPDEDDLDDLDEVLDEFAAEKLDSKPTPASSGPGRPATSDIPLPDLLQSGGSLSAEDDAFASQLQEGMADLLGELESSPEMQKQFEDMLREMGKGIETDVPGAAAKEPATASEAGKQEMSFQETIKRTMERMQESGEAADTAAASSSPADTDFMASILKEMESGGGGSDEDFSKMLMGMMEQLTNKEILYEPMKELDDKFPAWMEKNKEKTPEADLKRFETQQTLVREIVAKFEERGYSDAKVESREYILERMQKMQNEGSPPSDLVGDMDAAQDALGELDAGCPTQ